MSRNLGVIAPIPKDSWNSEMTYKALSIVTHNGSLYMAKTDVSAGVAPSDPSNYWMLLISQANAENVVKYTAQSATEAEKERARANIDAPGKKVVVTTEEVTNQYIPHEYGDASVFFALCETTGTLGLFYRETESSPWATAAEISTSTAAVWIIMRRGTGFYITDIRSGVSYHYEIPSNCYKVEVGLRDCAYGEIIKLG